MRDPFALLRWYRCQDLGANDPEQRLKARLVVGFALVGGSLVMGFALLYLVSLRFPEGAAVLAGEGLLVLCGPLVLRRTGSTAFAGNFLAAVVLLVVSSIASMRDDLGLPALMYLATIPLFSVYLAGKRSAWVWAGVASLVCVLFFVRKALGFARLATALEKLTQEQKDASDALALVGLFLVAVVVALAIENSRRVAQQARQELLQRLQQSRRLESVGLLAAGMAHEINNPLSYALSSGSFLKRRFAQLAPGESVTSEDLEELRECAEQVVDGNSRVRDIVRDLRRFSRAGSPDDVTVAVNAVVEDALRLAGPELKFRARVVTHLGAVPAVRGNEGRLCEVVLNLLINAAQAIEEGAPERNEVGVRTRAEAESVIIEVEDSGRGMPADELEIVFDPFFTRPQGKGTGLGLYTCYEVVTSMGGQIEAKSTPGKGSHFLVRLPRAEPEPAVQQNL